MANEFEDGIEKGVILKSIENIEKTLGELKISFDSFQRTIWKKIEDQGDKIEADGKTVATLIEQGKAFNDRISSLEAAKNWVIGSIVGSIILAVMTLILKK